MISADTTQAAKPAAAPLPRPSRLPRCPAPRAEAAEVPVPAPVAEAPKPVTGTSRCRAQAGTAARSGQDRCSPACGSGARQIGGSPDPAGVLHPGGQARRRAAARHEAGRDGRRAAALRSDRDRRAAQPGIAHRSAHCSAHRRRQSRQRRYPPRSKPAAAPATSGGYVLQIGSYKSQADADTAWKTYKAKHAALLSGYSNDVQQADLGEKGTWYRLRVGGLSNKEVASALCDRLKADGGACIPGR